MRNATSLNRTPVFTAFFGRLSQQPTTHQPATHPRCSDRHHAQWLLTALVGLMGLMVMAASMPSSAQGLNSQLDIKELIKQQTLKQANGQPQKLSSPVDKARAAPTKAATITKPKAKTSALEKDYSARAKQPLRLFGYDNFSSPNNAMPVHGAIPAGYRLGIGDELVITIKSSQTQAYQTAVDTEGRIILPELPPISAAGRTLGEFRQDLSDRVTSSILGAEVFVSIGRLRQIEVLVAGEINRPGMIKLTNLSSVLDALAKAGGIKKGGSLRRIQLVRHGQTRTIDLYGLLGLAATPADIGVEDGDRLIVPSLGKAIAIAGNVGRPGIYELAPGRSQMDAQRLLNWGGQTLRSNGNSFMLMRIDDKGRDQITRLQSVKRQTLVAGDLLMIRSPKASLQGAIQLRGHVQSPGVYSLDELRGLADLLGDRAIYQDDPYLLTAFIWRIDPYTWSRRWMAVDLQAVLNGRSDISLNNDDQIIILGRKDVEFLSSKPVLDTLARRAALDSVVNNAEEENKAIQATTNSGCSALNELSRLLTTEDASRFAAVTRNTWGGYDRGNASQQGCPAIFKQYASLLPFVLEQIVSVSGEVRQPGVYPVIAGTPIDAVIAVSGGLTRAADRSNIDIAIARIDQGNGELRQERHRLNIDQDPKAGIAPGSAIRFNNLVRSTESGPVLLRGEFLRPGVYDIRRGERLSQLIERAGGLTEWAYPLGAVFMRESLRKEEQRWIQQSVTDLDEAIIALVQRSRKNSSEASLAGTLTKIGDRLRNKPALGRMVMEADPIVLSVHPEKDLLLQPGDELVMPKRPSHVQIAGQVLSPGAQQFTAGSSPDQYIEMAGGYRNSADEDRVFVVLPNGASKRLKLASWNYDKVSIPPGSTIVVPRDPVPFDPITFGIDITDILSNLAVTAASLATINR